MPLWTLGIIIPVVVITAIALVFLAVGLTLRRRLRGSVLEQLLAQDAPEPASPDPQAPQVKATAAPTPPDRCPYCHDQLAGVLGACVACGTQHHAECLTENNGCAVLACAAGPQQRPQRSEKA